jgi:RNA polymerase sigma factor (sigma-70 family)
MEVVIDRPSEELLALNEALDRLAEKDQMKADLVKLRYFAGLTCKQAAQLLEISHSTADEYWAYAKAWLKAEIIGQDELSAI